jgi:hypothetical protein
MSLSPAAPTRLRKHCRPIDVQVFSRDDGLWGVEASGFNAKTRVAPLAERQRPGPARVRPALVPPCGRLGP